MTKPTQSASGTGTARLGDLSYRLGDPSAPNPTRRRPPRSPSPYEPEQDEDGQPNNLICARCLSPPVTVAWSQAEGKVLHTSQIGTFQVKEGGPSVPRICGGHVVPTGEEWRAAFAPGIVVPCYHTAASVKAHLVRLGRPAQSGGQSWSGTALCGRTNAGRNKNWRPLFPAAAAQAIICEDCKKAQAAEQGPSSRESLDGESLREARR